MNFDKAIFDKVNVFLIKHLWVYLFITLFTIFKTVINVLEVGRCEIPNLFTARTKKATFKQFLVFLQIEPKSTDFTFSPSVSILEVSKLDLTKSDSLKELVTLFKTHISKIKFSFI